MCLEAWGDVCVTGVVVCGDFEGGLYMWGVFVGGCVCLVVGVCGVCGVVLRGGYECMECFVCVCVGGVCICIYVGCCVLGVTNVDVCENCVYVPRGYVFWWSNRVRGTLPSLSDRR